MRRDLPSGTVTFLFTDVEGSTRLLHELGAEGYSEALAEHRRLIREACAAEGGVEVDTQGDAFFFAFPTAPGALTAANAFTETLASGPIQVRVGLHTGTPLLTDEGYVGADVHRAARIAAAGHGAQILVSSSTAGLVELELTDLGEHRFKDLSAPERIHQLGDGDFPALRSLYRTNLPVPATAFLGRERELADVVELLARADVRLLTLTGPGGTGKTRLALQAAAEAADGYPDGVFWVPLASLRDPTLILPAVAQALEIKEEPGTPLVATLTHGVASKRSLLVLDNVEHLLPAGLDELATLSAIAGPVLLLTSRERLQLHGEQLYPVPTLEEHEGVALFLVRARGLDPAFTDDGGVAELCTRLDNLPLAIELAAARTGLFTPEQLLGRLADRLDLLKAVRAADPRQQTLRATIEWSYELLQRQEQRLFQRLSVFADGCTFEAAGEVCGADPDALQSLLDKSLIRRRPSEAGPRYWMLETIREFAAERLEQAGDLGVVRDRHAEWMASGAFALRFQVRDYDDAAFAVLRMEHANVRAALTWALETGHADWARQILEGLWFFWIISGRASEGDEWASRVVSVSSEPSLAFAWSLSTASEFPRFRGDPERARELKEQAIEIFEMLPADDPRVAGSLAATHSDLADVLCQLGDMDRAADHAARGLEVRRELGDAGGIAHALDPIALIADRQGDLVEAARVYQEVCDMLDGLGEPLEAASALASLGDVRRRMGNREGARTALADALRRATEAGDHMWRPGALARLGLLAADEGDPERAVRLIVQANAEIRQAGLVLDVDIDAALESCRSSLGEEPFEREHAAGLAAATSENQVNDET